MEGERGKRTLTKKAAFSRAVGRYKGSVKTCLSHSAAIKIKF